MLAHYFFENVYSRTFLAFVLCIVIAFAAEIDALHEKWMVIAIFAVTMLLILVNVYNDYGLVLLMITLFILTYNNVRNSRKAN